MYVKPGFCKLFVDTLITMFSCIRKSKRHSFMFKRAFLSKIIIKFKEIPICENCFKRGFCSYAMSPLDSSRYVEYVQLNRSRCNVIDPTTAQFKTLSSIYVCLEAELEDAFKKQI